jgi:hypothetical protein
MFKPQFQGQEHSGIAKLDDLSTGILTTLRIMQRAASKDKPGYRQKLRQQLQDFVTEAMSIADAVSH